MWIVTSKDHPCIEEALHAGGSPVLFYSEQAAREAIDRQLSSERRHKFKTAEVELSMCKVVMP